MLSLITGKSIRPILSTLSKTNNLAPFRSFGSSGSIPFGHEFIKTKRSNLVIDDIIGLKEIKLYKLTSRHERSTGHEGYGESWDVYEAREVDDTLNIKPNGKKRDILIGFYGEDGDHKFDKLVESEWFKKMQLKIQQNYG